jgi:glutamate 5-kinase
MRMLIKIGSALISRGDRIHYDWLAQKVGEIARLHRRGDEIVIVSSGAVAAGMEIEGLAARPKDTLKLQLLSGEGQIKLMKTYKDLFKEHGIRVAQVLLTHHNFDTPQEERTIRQIMTAYLKQGTVPIVNENDLINKEELEHQRLFTDNDILAALVATRLKVDLTLILTDVDGLYCGDPKRCADVDLVEEVETIDNRIRRMASQETSELGLGGMISKIRAAEMLTPEGIDTLVANGRYPIEDILEKRVRRTLFRAAGRHPQEKKVPIGAKHADHHSARP